MHNNSMQISSNIIILLAGLVRRCPDTVAFTSVHSHQFVTCAACTYVHAAQLHNNTPHMYVCVQYRVVSVRRP